MPLRRTAGSNLAALTPMPVTGYADWRLFIENIHSGTFFMTVQDIAMRLTYGGARANAYLTSNAGDGNGSCYGSSESTPGSEFFKAFDETAGTAWASVAPNATTNQYLAFRFTSGVLITQFAVTGHTNTARSPKDCRVEYSANGGTDWSIATTISFGTWTSGETKLVSW